MTSANNKRNKFKAIFPALLIKRKSVIKIGLSRKKTSVRAEYLVNKVNIREKMLTSRQINEELRMNKEYISIN